MMVSLSKVWKVGGRIGQIYRKPYIFCLVKQLASGDFYVPEIQSIDIINHISIHILSSSITLLRLSSVQNSLLDD